MKYLALLILFPVSVSLAIPLWFQRVVTAPDSVEVVKSRLQRQCEYLDTIWTDTLTYSCVQIKIDTLELESLAFVFVRYLTAEGLSTESFLMPPDSMARYNITPKRRGDCRDEWQR